MRKLIPFAAALVSLQAAAQSGYDLEAVVPPGSQFHGVHGLRFSEDGTLYAVSVLGQSVFTVDVDTGLISRLVGPPRGMGDDIAIAPDGTLVWTAIEDGIVYARSADGRVRRLWADQRGVNAVSFSPDGERLFVTIVFYGDALYELDLEGEQAPRLVAEDLGGLNAFEVAEDGMIYGPLVFGGRIVRVDPDNGTVETVSEDVERPGALKLIGNGAAYVLDETEDGDQLLRVDLTSGETRVVATLPFGADNLALDPDGRIFVSLSEVNAIVEVFAATGEIRYVVEPTPLTSPAGFAIADGGGGGERLYVGDAIGGLRVVDAPSGAVEFTPVELFQPAHVDVAGDDLVAVSEVFGIVQRMDRETFEVLVEWDGFSRPADALLGADGNVVVAETGAGRLVETTGEGGDARRVVVEGLDEPTGLAAAGEGAVYVAETGGGRVVRVDLGDGAVSVVASGLAQPEGLAVDAAGRIIVAEVGGRRIVALDPETGERSILRADLPIGLSDGPSLYRDVETSGETIYFTSDIANTIYRLTPR